MGDTNENAARLLEQFKSRQLGVEDFLREFGKEKIYYSTPFGDHKDGRQKLFLLAGPENTAYQPVFTSMELMKEFYEKMGRAAYMIMQGSFLSFLETTKNANGSAPIKMGALIDPGVYDITVDAQKVEVVISIMKG